jgi:hypothetical protein
MAAALAYIERGWPVFPCEPGGKAPLGRLVPRGFLDATLDVEHARRWWTWHPNANVAIPTGAATFDVLDVDVTQKGSGYPAFNRLKRAGLVPEPLAVVTTPRGGMHVYVAGSSQPCGKLKAHHIDWKARGGYVLAPGSEVNGRPYTLVHKGTGTAMLNWGAVKQLLDPPKPAADIASRRREAIGTGVPGLAAWLSRQGEGNRNASLYWACCRALENGASEHDLDELVTVAKSIGLDEREALRTVRSALRTIRRSA